MTITSISFNFMQLEEARTKNMSNEFLEFGISLTYKGRTPNEMLVLIGLIDIFVFDNKDSVKKSL